LKPLQKFVDSILEDSFLSLTQGKNRLNILFYLPRIAGLVVAQEFHTNKIPSVLIKWDSDKLKNYADATLECLRKHQKDECQSLPSLNGLLGNNTKPINELLSKIEHPRHLHYFMSSLIDELNKFARREGTPPFIATPEDIQNALAEAKAQMQKK